ncbi:MAG: hypothetical protein EAX96_17695 [Candidatus Lokiarchaeota archaeon]|nr:hypothetical protein [Candidatus Lokiarchaeota archaeon]
MKIGIVSDGKYGERAFENICKIFECEWIQLEELSTSIILDDYELNIPDCDLYISYLRHPDQVIALAELEKPVILGVHLGNGLYNQLKEINPNVFEFPSMCSVEPNTNNFEVDVYANFFGRPKYKIEMKDGIVKKIEVLRSSPCGSSRAGQNFLKNKKISPEVLQEFAINVCHECRSPRFGKTCDKELAGLIHLRSLIDSLKVIEDKNNNVFSEFVEKIEKEYNSRILSCFIG